jgi:hypothetical protein
MTASGDITAFTIAPAAEPSSVPAVAPIGPQLPIHPRRPGSAPSTRKTADAMYSPPTARPWSSRSPRSRIGAARPMVAAPGRTPMKNEGNAIASTDQISACLRPKRSPTQPNSAPPIGRITKPAAKVPSAASSEAVGSPLGKKWAPIWTAKNPKSAKSYHSSMLPTTPAMTPRRIARGVRNSCVITPGGLMDAVAVMGDHPRHEEP